MVKVGAQNQGQLDSLNVANAWADFKMSWRTLNDDQNSFMNDPTQAMKLITQIGGTITLTPFLVSQLVENVGQKLFHHKSDD
jgi:hypothetical protein